MVVDNIQAVQIKITADEMLLEGLRKMYMAKLMLGQDIAAHESRKEAVRVFERLYDNYAQLYGQYAAQPAQNLHN